MVLAHQLFVQIVVDFPENVVFVGLGDQTVKFKKPLRTVFCLFRQPLEFRLPQRIIISGEHKKENWLIATDKNRDFAFGVVASTKEDLLRRFK